MSDRRIEIEDLGGLSELPPDDPRRRALDAQPSARAQLRAYQEFMSPGDSPRGERLAEAEEHLAAALEREIGVPIGASPARGAGPTVRRETASGGLLGWLLAPRLRPALAAAAVVVVVGALLIGRAMTPEREPQLRGSTTPAAGAWNAHLITTAGAAGTTLTWSAAPGAERYAVVFLASDLQEVARVSDLSATELALAPGSLPAGLVSGQAGLWRVIAYQGSDEVARSATAPIEIP